MTLSDVFNKHEEEVQSLLDRDDSLETYVQMLELKKRRIIDYCPDSREIIQMINHMIDESDWRYGYDVLLAIFLQPSAEYIPWLIRIIETGSEDAPIEPAIERLADMPVPVAAPCLTKALGYRHGADFGLSVPKKALRALSRIDTQEAWEAIAHTAKASDEECIREAAQWYLDHRGEL